MKHLSKFTLLDEQRNPRDRLRDDSIFQEMGHRVDNLDRGRWSEVAWNKAVGRRVRGDERDDAQRVICPLQADKINVSPCYVKCIIQYGILFVKVHGMLCHVCQFTKSAQTPQ